MYWQRADLDFPVLMLRAGPWPPFVATVGGGSFGDLSTVALTYGDGDGDEALRLETLARRGRRMGPHGPVWIGDRIEDQAGNAVRGLHLSRLRPGDQASSDTRRQVADGMEHGLQLAAQFPGPPWQARTASVDDVDFAMWSATFPDGFAAVLDYGPVVLTAWGADLEAWDWNLTAAPPAEVWPLLDPRLGG